MNDDKTRIEKDSMGEVQIPVDALYGAQTQRAVNNFPISGLRMPRAFIKAIGLIKYSAAQVNRDLGLLDEDKANAIMQAAKLVAGGKHDAHFPVDVFQTGSGTSSNMNANEVIAHLAKKLTDVDVHPNDHVNMGQSSNDVIPTAIHVSAAIECHETLIPALKHLQATLNKKADECQNTIKTGRTHLMDAMPLSMGQELGAFAAQIHQAKARIDSVQVRLCQLAQGGTAIGSGINTHKDFGAQFAQALSAQTGIAFRPADNYFAAIASQDAAVELSGQLRVLSVSLMKMANDLRWMNSGPLTGLGEISLKALQPGSSIMPGKVNPVIPEAVCMVCAQVMGNDATIAIAGQAGNFQLNVMLPVIAYNVLQSITLLSHACMVLADKAIADFQVNQVPIQQQLARNPILVTSLNPIIGYEKGAAIAKQAYQEGRSVLDVAKEKTDLSEEELERLLDPAELIKGGICK